MFQTKGTVTDILAPITGTSAKGAWNKTDIVVQVEQGDYPKSICFTLFNKEDVIKGLKIGQEVSVNFSIEAREYQGKFFNNVSAFKVEVTKAIAEPVRQANRTNAQAKTTSTPPRITNDDDDSGLPF